MSTDSEIKRDVEAELQSDPTIDATDIGAAVKNGVVTLAGFVRSYSEKLEAEAAAKRVTGVVGVFQEMWEPYSRVNPTFVSTPVVTDSTLSSREGNGVRFPMWRATS